MCPLNYSKKEYERRNNIIKKIEDLLKTVYEEIFEIMGK